MSWASPVLPFGQVVNQAPVDITAQVPIFPAPFGGPPLVFPAIMSLPVQEARAGDWIYLHQIQEAPSAGGTKITTGLAWRSDRWTKVVLRETRPPSDLAGSTLAKVTGVKKWRRTEWGMPYGGRAVEFLPDTKAPITPPITPKVPVTPRGSVARAAGPGVPQTSQKPACKAAPRAGGGSTAQGSAPWAAGRAATDGSGASTEEL